MEITIDIKPESFEVNNKILTNRQDKKYYSKCINYIQKNNDRKHIIWFNYIIDKTYINRYIILNKSLSICAHILIMVIFEIYFFFYFIVDIENEKFIGKIDSYFHHLEPVILNEIEIQLVHRLLDNKYYYKETILKNLYENYITSREKQHDLLNHLFIASCKMGGCLCIIFFILLIISLHKSNRKYIEWKIIFFENILMFLFLGIFEYYFFINIIMKYEPVTNEEIQYKLAYGGFNYLDRVYAIN